MGLSDLPLTEFAVEAFWIDGRAASKQVFIVAASFFVEASLVRYCGAVLCRSAVGIGPVFARIQFVEVVIRMSRSEPREEIL